MTSPKVLAVASAADLDFRYGCTPAWWQLWKALAEQGVDLIVTTYRGRAIESPWWRAIPNPLHREAELFATGRGLVARLQRQEFVRRDEHDPADTLADRTVRGAIRAYVTPRWRRHLERTIEREGGVDAVVVFTVPMAHFVGIPSALRERFDVPVVYYDGDLPMSLPEHGGTDTSGFNYYVDADPGEYDLVVGNSDGALERVKALGARRTEAIHWAVDPDLFRPHETAKEVDVFFYGHSDKFRLDWMHELIGEPSRLLSQVDFAVGGYDYRGDTGRARMLGRIPFNAFPRAISAARVNLNITRRPHAETAASSTCRLFELAACGAAVVSNPLAGVERWFDPDRDLLIAHDAGEAIAAYTELLSDPSQAESLGRHARERVIDEHTYGHRARQLLHVLGLGLPVSAGV